VLEGRVYADAVDTLRATLARIDRAGVRTLVVDATALVQIDALALRALVATLRVLRARGGGMVVFGLNPQITRTFELVGLDRVVTLVATRDDAFQATPGAAPV
jgi:anti-anti-sigma factor